MFNIFACIRFFQCCGSGMIYSGSGSSSEFSEFRIPIQAKVPDSCGSGSNPCYLIIFGNCKQNHLKFNRNEESINYLPFYIILHSYSTQRPEFTEKLHFYLSAFSYLAGSGSMRIRIHPQHCSQWVLYCMYIVAFCLATILARIPQNLIYARIQKLRFE